VTTPRRSPLRTGLLVVVVLGGLAAAGGLAYLFLRPAPPPAVGLATPAPASSAPGATNAPVPTTPPGTGAPAGLDGTWTVDPSIGSFSDFSGSFAGYRVDETLADIGANTAVGRTSELTGTLVLSGMSITSVDVTVQMSSLRSDNEQRDGRLRSQAIETSTFPTATFTLTTPIELGSAPVDGRAIEVTASGDLTLHGVTRSVTVPIQARLSGDVVTVTGSIDIVFADYAIERPTSFAVLSIEDHGIMEFQLHFRRG
jgi:polyisoprenoid-binding protein YceI